MPPRPTARFVPPPARIAGGAWLACLLLLAPAASAQTEVDRIDITGRQNLTLGSGARAYGMGGAFLARADDATAASWNPAGLSYLRVPELSLVGVSNSFDVTRGLEQRQLRGAGGRLRRLHLADRPRRRAGRGPAELPAGHLLRRLPPDRAVRPDDGPARAVRGREQQRRVRRGRVRHGPSPEPPRPRRVHGEPLAQRLRPDPVAHDPQGQPAPAPRVRPRLPPERVELQPRPDRLAVRAAQRGRGLQDPVHRRREPRQVAPRLVGHDHRHRARSPPTPPPARRSGSTSPRRTGSASPGGRGTR